MRALVTADRGVSSTVSYVLAIGITTVLVVSLVFAMGGFVEDESKRATQHSLEALGGRLADDVAAADQLAQQGGSATVETGLPAAVVGESYTVEVARGSDCDGPLSQSDTCLLLAVPSAETTVRQPLANDSTITLSGTPGAGLSIEAMADATGSTVGTFTDAPDVDPTVGVGAAEGASGTGAIVGNTDPVAGFTFAPGDPVTGTNVTFRNDTADLDGFITSYEWSFELPTGGNATRTGGATNFTYDTPGVYTVRLEVTDDDGEVDSVRRRVPVSGLVYRDDAEAVDFDGNGRAGGVELSLNNTWGDSVEILTVGVDPSGSTVTELDEGEGGDGRGDHEIRFESPPVDTGDTDSEDASVDYFDPLSVPDDGVIVDLDEDGDERDSNAVVGSGQVVTLELSEFTDGSQQLDDAEAVAYDVAVRYRVNGSIYVTKFRIFEIDDGPTVDWESAADWDNAAPQTNVTHPGDEIRLDAAATSGLPTSDLRVWLPLNETTNGDCASNPGDACDYGGSTNYQFDLDGNPTRGVPGFDNGTAYAFDGDDTLVDENAEETYIQNEDAITVSMWVKADATGTNAGLLDSGSYGGYDNELSLRYNLYGDRAPTVETFTTGVRTGPYYSDAYEYEYETGLQTTDWQHVLITWEDGEPVRLYTDGTERSITGGDGAPPPGEMLSGVDYLEFGRAQDLYWDGRIDEVRIYDRALSDSDIQALAADGGLRRGSFETTWNTTAESLDLSDLRLGYDGDRNGGTVEVTVYARRDDGTVVAADPVRLSGNAGVKEVEGLVGSADEFKLRVEFTSTGGDPSVDSLTLGD